MRQILFKTGDSSYSPLVIRILLGVVLFAHGAQKLLGWFGGYGFNGTMSYFTDTVGLPWIIGFLVIIIESIGAISIFFGFATRLWSIGVSLLTIGIIITAHSDHFFMNWYGSQRSEGFEYFLLMLGMSISLVTSGAGRISVDALLDKKTTSPQKQDSYSLSSVRA